MDEDEDERLIAWEKEWAEVQFAIADAEKSEHRWTLVGMGCGFVILMILIYLTEVLGWKGWLLIVLMILYGISSREAKSARDIKKTIWEKWSRKQFTQPMQR
jgi:hypothetical protein